MLIITNMRHYTCHYTSVIIFSTISKTNISWLFTLQHQQLFLKLLDVSTRLFCICLFYAWFFYASLFHNCLFIFTYSTYFVILMMMQFHLLKQVSSLIFFLNVKPIYYYMELSCQDTTCHLFAPVYDVCLVDRISKADDIANGIIIW